MILRLVRVRIPVDAKSSSSPIISSQKPCVEFLPSDLRVLLVFRTYRCFNMPKATKTSNLGRVARRVAAAGPLPLPIDKNVRPETKEGDTVEKRNLSRGQRRRLAKREQYLKREKMILASLKLKSQEEQKGKIDGLNALREALLGTTEQTDQIKEDEAVATHKSNKGKKRMVSEEAFRMNLVLQHPAFKENPFATIKEHLQNTLAQEKVKMEQESIERSKEEKLKKYQLQLQKKERLQGVKRSRKKFKATRSR
eukprot:scaffold12982_cov129-Cylindrotheca_fusiformis.AAC.3